MDIHIPWILSTFSGYYPHLWIFRIYMHLVDIICIGFITSYLARNVRPFFTFTHIVYATGAYTGVGK